MPRTTTPILSLLFLAALGASAAAVDGVVEINQAAVFAGGITPGDTAGFPATLSQPGSYRLTGNLDVTKKQDGSAQSDPENVTAIDVTADSVTIDLNGFAIRGPAVCTGEPPGMTITCAPSGTGNGVRALTTGVSVANGLVQGMGSAGVRLAGNVATVERVRAIANAGIGIETGSPATVNGCVATGNSSNGIFLNGSDFIATNNLADSNGASGLNAGGNLTAIGNTTARNFVHGIAAGAGSVVVNNIAVSNKEFGLTGGSSTGYANNSFNNNNGSDANPQVSGATEMPPNICGGNLTCP